MRTVKKRKACKITNRSTAHLRKKRSRCSDVECAFNLFNKTKSHLIVPDLNQQYALSHPEAYSLDFKGDCDFISTLSGTYKANNDIICWGSPVFYKRIKDSRFAYIVLFLHGNKDLDQTTGRFDLNCTINRHNQILQLENPAVHMTQLRWHLALATDLGSANLPESAVMMGPYVQHAMFSPCDLVQSARSQHRWQLSSGQSKSLVNAKLSEFNDSHNFLECTVEPIRSDVKNNGDLAAQLRNELCQQHATAISMCSALSCSTNQSFAFAYLYAHPTCITGNIKQTFTYRQWVRGAKVCLHTMLAMCRAVTPQGCSLVWELQTRKSPNNYDFMALNFDLMQPKLEGSTMAMRKLFSPSAGTSTLTPIPLASSASTQEKREWIQHLDLLQHLSDNTHNGGLIAMKGITSDNSIQV